MTKDTSRHWQAFDQVDPPLPSGCATMAEGLNKASEKAEISKEGNIIMSNELNMLGRNAFEVYADAGSRRFAGELLKFTKGDWIAGVDANEVPHGTEFVALMDTLEIGYQRWENSRPVESRMGRVAEGYTPPLRAELGDTDSALWPADNEGRPRDPWEFCNQLTLVRVDDPTVVCTFTTSSRGGFGAIRDLAANYGRKIRQSPDVLPIVALESDSYIHKDRGRGRIKIPVFRVVKWVPKSNYEDERGAEDLPDFPF